jgi:hypothetical protein
MATFKYTVQAVVEDAALEGMSKEEAQSYLQYLIDDNLPPAFENEAGNEFEIDWVVEAS